MFRRRQLSKLLFEFIVLSDVFIQQSLFSQTKTAVVFFICGLLTLALTSSPPPPPSCLFCPGATAELPLTHHLEMH